MCVDSLFLFLLILSCTLLAIQHELMKYIYLSYIAYYVLNSICMHIVHIHAYCAYSCIFHIFYTLMDIIFSGKFSPRWRGIQLLTYSVKGCAHCAACNAAWCRTARDIFAWRRQMYLWLGLCLQDLEPHHDVLQKGKASNNSWCTGLIL